MADNPLLQVDGLRVEFGHGKDRLRAVDGDVEPGQVAAVVVDHPVRRRRHLAGVVADGERASVDEDELAPAEGSDRRRPGVEGVGHAEQCSPRRGGFDRGGTGEQARRVEDCHRRM